jgi:hypothetical protein
MDSTVTVGGDDHELAVHQPLGLLESPEFQISILTTVRQRRSKWKPTVNSTLGGPDPTARRPAILELLKSLMLCIRGLCLAAGASRLP